MADVKSDIRPTGWDPKCGIVPSRSGLLPSQRTLIDFLAEEFGQSDMA